MIAADELELDGSSQAEQVRDVRVSAVELTDAAIARLEALNPILTCVVIERFAQRGRRQTRRRRLNPQGGPLAGVPVLLKDAVRMLAATGGRPGGAC